MKPFAWGMLLLLPVAFLPLRAEAQRPPSIGGDAANQMNVTFNLQGTCFPHGTDQMLFSNPGPKTVYFTVVSRTAFLPGTDTQVVEPGAYASSFTALGQLPAHQQGYVDGCLMDSNGLVVGDFQQWYLQYVVLFSFTAPPQNQGGGAGGGGGGGGCQTRPPKLTVCAASNLPASMYRLESTTYRVQCSYPDPGHLHTWVTDYNCSNMCVDVSTQHANFQQINCKAGVVPSEDFVLVVTSNGCYRIEEASSHQVVVTDPSDDDNGDAGLLGRGQTQVVNCGYDAISRMNWSFTQIGPPASPADAGAYNIVNHATGKCIKLVPKIHYGPLQGDFGGPVNAGSCNAPPHVGDWRLVKDSLP